MRLMTFKYDNQVMTGYRDQGGVRPFKVQKSILDIIKEDSIPEAEDYIIAFKDIEFMAPIPHPIHDVICLGLNYFSHIDEMKDSTLGKKNNAAIYFGKRCKEIVGHNQNVSIGNTAQLDYENELAIIIKKECKNIKKEDAHNYIYGYSVANDFSARDFQTKHTQWYLGKSGDTHTAMGPWLVTIDEVGYPLEKMMMTLVNDEIRQESNTQLMIHTIDEVIEELSHHMTLEAGDIILTGTPAGVVAGNKDLAYLKSGDKVDCMIDNIGVLHNNIVE